MWKLDPKKCGFGVDPPPVWKKSPLFIFFFEGFPYTNLFFKKYLDTRIRKEGSDNFQNINNVDKYACRYDHYVFLPYSEFCKPNFEWWPFQISDKGNKIKDDI